MNETIIMGLDASTTATGWAVFKGKQLLGYGCIRPEGKTWRERILQLGEPLSEVIAKYQPQKIIMEDVPLSTGGGVRTGIILGALQGFIFGIIHSYNIEVQFVLPSEWRSVVGVFCGTREGTKRQMLKQASVECANRLFGLGLKWVSPSSKQNEDDISDAILTAYSQLLPPKPKTQKKVFKKKTE